MSFDLLEHTQDLATWTARVFKALDCPELMPAFARDEISQMGQHFDGTVESFTKLYQVLALQVSDGAVAVVVKARNEDMLAQEFLHFCRTEDAKTAVELYEQLTGEGS